MKNTIFYLSTCDTCARILDEVGHLDEFDLIDIKATNISAKELDWLKKKVGTYEDLFSRRARKYRSMGLAEKNLTEKDYRALILEEYTFLKRPVIIYKDKVFVGNAPSVVKSAVAHVNG